MKTPEKLKNVMLNETYSTVAKLLKYYPKKRVELLKKLNDVFSSH